MKPAREHATNNAQTYFVTSDTWERRALFRTESWARLFFRTLLSHRGEAYLLHEFVLMPDHFHLLITPMTALERAMQFIKGGFSHLVKKELGSNAEIWRCGFADHRIRDAEDYDRHVHYIHLNPVKKHLCASPADYRFSSAYPGWKLDPVPQGLKPPGVLEPACGTAEAVPFQNSDKSSPAFAESRFGSDRTAEAVPFQNSDKSSPAFAESRFGLDRTPEAVPFQNSGKPGLESEESRFGSGGTVEIVPLQNAAQRPLEASTVKRN